MWSNKNNFEPFKSIPFPNWKASVLILTSEREHAAMMNLFVALVVVIAATVVLGSQTSQVSTG